VWPWATGHDVRAGGGRGWMRAPVALWRPAVGAGLDTVRPAASSVGQPSLLSVGAARTLACSSLPRVLQAGIKPQLFGTAPNICHEAAWAPSTQAPALKLHPTYFLPGRGGACDCRGWVAGDGRACSAGEGAEAELHGCKSCSLPVVGHGREVCVCTTVLLP